MDADDHTANLALAGKDGAPRAVLSVHAEDTPSLRRIDKDGHHAQLGVAAGVPRLLLTDKDDKGNVTLGVSARAPALILHDQDGKGSLALHRAADGTPGLTLDDKDGKRRVALEVPANGLSNLVLQNKDGKGGVTLGGLDDGLSLLAPGWQGREVERHSWDITGSDTNDHPFRQERKNPLVKTIGQTMSNT